MADALVRELNRLGYQPVFLPRTGVSPPELYNYERANQRLVRRGALARYLPSVAELEPTTGQLADINYKYTSSKKLDAAVSFLENALRCIGISAVPKLDLGFTGARELSFSFAKVTYASVDPAELDPLLRGMMTDGIPTSYVEAGLIHVAYEYAYAPELLLSRADRRSFTAGISGDIGNYVDLGVAGSVSLASESTLSFKSTGSVGAAFAYKAAKLAREGSGWALFPEVVVKRGLLEERTAFVPQPAVVLSTESE